MVTQEQLARAKRLKRFEKADYPKLIKKNPGLKPWDFGCPDWDHDEEGRVNAWAVRQPDPELANKEDTDAIPLEKQHYEPEREETIRENYQAGWSKKVDQGIQNQYWKDYWMWN